MTRGSLTPVDRDDSAISSHMTWVRRNLTGTPKYGSDGLRVRCGLCSPPKKSGADLVADKYSIAAMGQTRNKHRRVTRHEPKQAAAQPGQESRQMQYPWRATRRRASG